MSRFLQEFKTFALKGNVVDLAVGVMIGAAFQEVVSSLTQNILSPLIGLFVKQNFDTLALTIPALGVTLHYGAFITTLLNFLILALVVFGIVKAMNRLLAIGKKQTDEAPAPTTKTCPYCCSEINIKASRCPACTSQLEQTAKA